MAFPLDGARCALGLAIALGLGAAALGAHSAGPTTLDGFDRFVGEDGTLRFEPEAVAGLTHLGSWFVPSGDNAGFHHVYTQAAAIAAYREVGAFPDGTALVKEIASHRRGSYTTGSRVASATDTRLWFVMVKDVEGRFGGSPLWGNGWGGGLFESDDPSRNVATDFRSDCLGCHAPAQPTDWVYVEGYPTLEAR